MTEYRIERKSLSRVNGHNLVAAVAYRAGLKLTDHNKLNPKATTHDYTKKRDVAHTEILLPDKLAAQMSDAKLTLNFEEVANLVEKGETTLRGKMKMGAKLANEYVLSGSHELSLDENIKAFQEFAKRQSEEQNVIAMVFVHDPKRGKDMSAKSAANGKGKDMRNIHAHIILLSRQVEVKNGELKLGKKCDSDLSNDERTRPVVADELVGTIDPVTKKRIQQGRGLCSNSEFLKGVRKQWADIQNESLARHNLLLVTHKSYKDLGLKLKPTMHLGKNASHLEKMGIQTEIGKYNESVKEQNHAHIEHATSRLVALAEQGISDSEQRVGYHEQQAARADRIIASRARATRPNIPNPFDEQYRASVSRREQRAAEFNEQASAFTSATEQAIDTSKKCINRHQQQAARADRIIASRARTARSSVPSHFDDNARRARAAKLDEQQRRADRNTRSYGYADENTAKSIERLKINLAMRLISRHNKNNSLQDYENILEHSQKFDARQLLELDKFARIIGADKQITDFREDSRRISHLFTDEVVVKHFDIIEILKNASKERMQYSSKTPKFESQDVLNDFTVGNNENITKVPCDSNESLLERTRRFRPR